MVNFTEEDPFDPKAVWLNAEHIKQSPLDDLSERLLPFATGAGLSADSCKMRAVTPLIRERIKLLRDVTRVADFFFLDELAPYDLAELIPQKGDAAMARVVLEKGREILARTEFAFEFTHDPVEAALRNGASDLKIKAGQMFQPIRVAACGRKEAPPLFETLVVLGRETCLKRIGRAIEMLAS
jgi:glutamyl-tRNA synthetase